MADFNKVAVCYMSEGVMKHEIVEEAIRFIQLVEAPSVDIHLCASCTEMSDEEIESLITKVKQDIIDFEKDTDREAALVVFNELKEKYGFE